MTKPFRTPIAAVRAAARLITPVLTAIERFLDARAEAFRAKGWV